MAERLAGFRYAEVPFDKAARVVADADRKGAGRLLREAGVTDLVVLAHGWNNDMDEARTLYRRLAGSLRDMQRGTDAALAHDRELALLGVLWPSKKFADEDLIAGGAAAFGADAQEQLAHRIDDVADAFDASDAAERLNEAKALIPRLEDSATARARFAELVRGALPEDAGEDDDASQEFLELPAESLFTQLDDPTLDDPSLSGIGVGSGDAGGAAMLDDANAASAPGGAADVAAGAAAGEGGLGGFVRSAQRLLNFATYYQMKARAGKIGEQGLAPLLRELAEPSLRVHLVGHSFGGRLVAATAASRDGVGGGLGSVTLLQAAFSHYGFAKDWKPGTDGAFRGLLTGDRLGGPLVITHTRNDKAVGIAYALASRVANQVGAEVGGPDSIFGGIGANGAQRTPGAVQGRLLPAGERYSLSRGVAHNLLADRFISDHSAVVGPEVAHAILSAISSTL